MSGLSNKTPGRMTFSYTMTYATPLFWIDVWKDDAFFRFASVLSADGTKEWRDGGGSASSAAFRSGPSDGLHSRCFGLPLPRLQDCFVGSGGSRHPRQPENDILGRHRRNTPFHSKGMLVTRNHIEGVCEIRTVEVLNH